MTNDLASVPAADLARELQIRGWDVRFRVVKPPSEGERNTAPEEKWLEIWSHLNPPETDVYGRLARLNWAVRMLVELLEPPSVRERRMNGG